MNNISPKLALPFIQPAQAQKHITHNEAIKHLDVLVQAVVEDDTLASPPAAATEGASFIVADGGTDVWAGHEGEVATLYSSGWEFIHPQEGWSFYVKAKGSATTYTGTTWTGADTQILRPTQVGVSAEPDDINRLSVSSDATLFNHAGTGHQQDRQGGPRVNIDLSKMVTVQKQAKVTLHTRRAQYATALGMHIQETARSQTFTDALSLASYAQSSNPVWRTQAQVFLTWRDAVWEYAQKELDALAAGVTPAGSIKDFIVAAPMIKWPQGAAVSGDNTDRTARKTASA